MRLFPVSLKGQLVALTLVALIVSQVAGFLVILNDRQHALTVEWFHHILSRTATAVDMLDSTPEEFHEKILRTASTGAVRYSIDPRPFPSQQNGDPGSALPNEFHKVFGDRADDSILIVYPKLDEASRLELLLFELWRDLRRTLLPKSSYIPRPSARATYARTSIRLKSGQWLNATISPRPFAPPASPLLVQLGTMAIFSGLGIIAVINRVTEPMKELANAAASLGRGEAVAKLEEKGPREVRETVHAFNEMQDRLGRFVHDRARMLAALGHDLRTPITSLRLHAEFIDDEETRVKILETLDEMQQMAEATLSFAREEASQEETRLVDFGALVSTVCADLADAGRNVICQDISGFTLRCRPIGVKRALRNIVENAVAYGKRARVSVIQGSSEVLIQVDDDGPGIHDEDFEKVFKPFVRLEGSRSRDTGGVGLGLAIARSIIRSHGGDITLENRLGGGLRVTLMLPAPPASEAPRLTVAAPDKAAA